jgi:transposase
VHLNLTYRWFCRLGLDGKVPDQLTFSKNRHGRFRDCDLLRKLFETVVERRMAEGLVDGSAFAVDASLIAADANEALQMDQVHRPDFGFCQTLLSQNPADFMWRTLDSRD